MRQPTRTDRVRAPLLRRSWAGTGDSGDLAEDLTDLLLATGDAMRERGSGLLISVDRAFVRCEPWASVRG
jgi:hypothetical protein